MHPAAAAAAAAAAANVYFPSPPVELGSAATETSRWVAISDVDIVACGNVARTVEPIVLSCMGVRRACLGPVLVACSVVPLLVGLLVAGQLVVVVGCELG